ncbi:hypothetical protein Trydic_g2173 [Trypoxylus dichotomus]
MGAAVLLPKDLKHRPIKILYNSQAAEQVEGETAGYTGIEDNKTVNTYARSGIEEVPLEAGPMVGTFYKIAKLHIGPWAGQKYLRTWSEFLGLLLANTFVLPSQDRVEKLIELNKE